MLISSIRSTAESIYQQGLRLSKAPRAEVTGQPCKVLPTWGRVGWRQTRSVRDRGSLHATGAKEHHNSTATAAPGYRNQPPNWSH